MFLRNVYNPGKLVQKFPFSGKKWGIAEILHDIVVPPSNEPLMYLYHPKASQSVEKYSPS